MTLHVEEIEIISARPHSDVRIERCPRWVRAYVDGKPIADSKKVLLVTEPRRLPVYYFPFEHVRLDLLEQTAYSRGPAGVSSPVARWTYRGDNRTIDNVGWTYREPDAEHAPLRDHIAFYWGKLDHWFEEDAEVYVHPRDPHSRVDAMPSSRHVKVVVDGQVVAETRRPYLLFETGLPTRYYIPRVDVRLDLLEASETTSQCPYKGQAVYWSVRDGGGVHTDLVWSYPFPIPECSKIENLMAFFNEKVDIYVDGELEVRPQTEWS